MILISLVTGAVTGRIDETVNAVFSGAESAVTTLVSFAGVMCFWTGMMKLAEGSGISGVIRRVISPAVNRLFCGCGEKAREYASMNMTANILGMGNAATPMGMMAAQELDRENDNPDVPSDAMCMLVVLNTTSLQLMPTTIIALRAAAGSADPVSVIVPVWIASAAAMAAGIAAVKIMCARRAVRKR